MVQQKSEHTREFVWICNIEFADDVFRVNVRKNESFRFEGVDLQILHLKVHLLLIL